jgi:tight adherence protein C
METIRTYFDMGNEWLTSRFGDLAPMIVVGLLGVLLILVVLPALLKPNKDPFNRSSGKRDGEQTSTSSKPRGLRVGGKDERLDRFSQYLQPQDQDELSASQLTMIRAGYRSKGAVQMFHFLQLVGGIGGLVLGTIYLLIAGGGSAQASILTVLLPGCVGYYAAEILGAAPFAGAPGTDHPGLSRHARPDAGLRRGRPVARPGDQPRGQGDRTSFPRCPRNSRSSPTR